MVETDPRHRESHGLLATRTQSRDLQNNTFGGWTVTQLQRRPQSWRAFLSVASQAANTQGENIATAESSRALDAVAVGNGKAAVFALVSARLKSNTFTVGPIIVNSFSVKIQDGTAQISACVDDQSYEVGQTGKVVTPAPRRQAYGSTLVRTGTTWKVSNTRLGGHTCPTQG